MCGSSVEVYIKVKVDGQPLRSFFAMTRLTVSSDLPSVEDIINNQAKAMEASSQAWHTTAKANEKLIDLVATVLQNKPNIPLYSARDTLIDERTNWFCPLYQTHARCFLCHYFGHGIEDCPNITKSASKYCIRCWTEGHTSSSCTLSSNHAVTPPFKLDFIHPTDFLKKLFFS